MKIDVVLPVIDQANFTDKAIGYWAKNAHRHFRVLVIDNGSEVPYCDAASWSNLGIYNPKAGETRQIPSPEIPWGDMTLTVHNAGRNLGLTRSLYKALELSTADVVVFSHNDVFIHREGWDTTIREFFEKYPKLAMAGAVGAVGVGTNGGRMGTYTRFLGKECGSCECHEHVWQHHGQWTPDEGVPSAALDGCLLVFRRAALDAIPLDEYFHHFYDRCWPLTFWDAGYYVMTIPIELDHYSGLTSARSKVYHESAAKWLEEHQEPTVDSNADNSVYLVGLRKWTAKWVSRLPMIVDDKFRPHWK